MTDTRLTGIVKWFDSRRGYGFVTSLSEGEYNGKDIFIHFMIQMIYLKDQQDKFQLI